MVRSLVAVGILATVLFPCDVAGAPLALRVRKTQIENERGVPVLLRGVNAAGLEWSSDGEGHILDTIKTAIGDWRANVIRVPLAQDRWFGKAPEQKDEVKAYRALVDRVVELCSSHDCYVILDLHWSDAGEWGRQIGQHVMPDLNSLEFWKSCASVYQNHPAVIFDLYNEPHDVSWDVWRSGGTVSEKATGRNPAKTFQAPGMQSMLDAVRSTGAKNVVIVGGLDWSYDMSGFLAGNKLDDPDGNGIIYANHAYPFKGDPVDRWVAKMERAARELPIIVSEFGSEPEGVRGVTGEQWVSRVVEALHAHGWSWTAWDLHPAAGPRLISDWKYTPTPGFGALVKHALVNPARPSPSPTATRQPPEGQTPLGIFQAHADIGANLHPGSAQFDPSAGRYTITGSGENMWFAHDAFHYAWTRRSGDLSLAADVGFVGPGREAHRKACLIIRQGLDDDDAYVDVALHGDGLTSLQFRQEKGGTTHEVQANLAGPKRLRIAKRGKYVVMDLAADASEPTFSGAAARITFQDPFYVGLGVCAHNKDVTETAVFSNLELKSTAQPAGSPPILYSTLETQTISSTDRRVVFVTPTRIEAPNWTRDGLALVYNSGGRIYRIPALGGTPQVIDTGFATRCNNDHGISPDGTTLVISDQSQGSRKSLIYTLPIAGGTPRLVTPTGPSYWHGWSPDGKALAFCGDRGGEFDIYTIPAMGGPERRLTTAPGLDDGPEYSPDGQWIYFNSVRSGLMQIWRMKTDGSGQEPVTSDEFNNWFPHLAPDGRSLVFLSYDKRVSGHPENQDVAVRLLNLSTRKISVLSQVYGGQGTINVPCFSPDGRKIAFVSYQWVPAKAKL
jgi:hypothetical protein